MSKRQVRKDALLVRQTEHLDQSFSVEREGPEAVHHALWDPRRSGSVDDGGEIVRVAHGRPRDRTVRLDQCVPSDLAIALRGGENDGRDVRRAARRRDIDAVRRAGEAGLGLAMFEDPPDRLRP